MAKIKIADCPFCNLRGMAGGSILEVTAELNIEYGGKLKPEELLAMQSRRYECARGQANCSVLKAYIASHK